MLGRDSRVLGQTEFLNSHILLHHTHSFMFYESHSVNELKVFVTISTCTSKILKTEIRHKKYLRKIAIGLIAVVP